MAEQYYLLLLTVCSVLTPVTPTCPVSCTCTAGNTQVTCSQPGTFSSFQDLVNALPTNVSTVVVKDQQIEDLRLNPPNPLQYTQLISLSVTNSGVKTIYQSALNGLGKLETLDLTDNHITSVPPYFAQDCTNLNLLDLSSNIINSSGIYTYSFAGLIKLKWLKLKGNQLGSGLVLDVAASTSLLEIDLSDNDLTDVSNVFWPPYMASLQVLDLSENSIRLTGLSGGSLGFPQLKVLRVFQNVLTEVPVYLLRGMSYLEKVNFEGNAISSIPREFFAELVRLVRIDFSNNAIKRIEPGLFSDCSKVEVLYLSRNVIKVIPDGVFSNMSRLIELHLSTNQVTALNSESFKGLGSLEVLHLQDNLLNPDASSSCFDPLVSLEILQLQDNGILNIPSTWLSNLSALKQLYFERNEIFSVDGQTFSQLSSLELLSLHENSLTDVQLDSNLPKLKEVRLGSNSLSSLRATALIGMPLLQIIDISRNTLLNLSSTTFASNVKLQSISLEHNKLAYVDPHMFLTLAQLTKLDLSNNPLCLNAQQASDLGRVPGVDFNLSSDCSNTNVPPTNAVSTTTTTTTTIPPSSQATHGKNAEDVSVTDEPNNNVTLIAVSTTLTILLLATVGLGAFCYVRRRKIRPSTPFRNSGPRKKRNSESKPKITKQPSVESTDLASWTKQPSTDILVVGSELQPSTSYSTSLSSKATLGSKIHPPPSDVMNVGSGHRYEYLPPASETSSELRRHKFSPGDPANRPLPDRPRHNYSSQAPTGRSLPTRDSGDGKDVFGTKHHGRARDGHRRGKVYRK